ncbi:hypothetical protein KIW84_010991 [Lathyrus oleraceus]|uniref:Uncharacterized protein n=1 Tax=Pisum sativum TaxID=3888 RepID=A0A9D5BEK2_PEA|nr:hypothetical protein KIW84_010991 [Pisum sativum]
MTPSSASLSRTRGSPAAFTTSENFWMVAFSSPSKAVGCLHKDVLENIGHVYREILWQISLLENTKREIEDDVASSLTDSQPAEADANETEDQRFKYFRQILDPLFRRRTSGWGIESQFFDLINLYRDLGRATGSSHQTNSIGSSNRRLGSSNQLNQSGSVDVSEANNKECDKQRMPYASYCDMVRSLSFHITRLSQELKKIMLQPSRRRDDIVSVSPASKPVASTFACIILDHRNFGGPAKLNQTIMVIIKTITKKPISLSRGIPVPESQGSSGLELYKKNLARNDAVESPVNFDFFGGQQQLSGRQHGMLQPLPRQHSGINEMHLLQQQALLNQTQELQGQQQFHQLEANQLHQMNIMRDRSYHVQTKHQKIVAQSQQQHQQFNSLQ